MNWLNKLYLKLFGVKCPTCGGFGKVIFAQRYINKCYRCNGIGKVKRFSKWTC